MLTSLEEGIFCQNPNTMEARVCPRGLCIRMICQNKRSPPNAFHFTIGTDFFAGYTYFGPQCKKIDHSFR